MDIPGYVYQLVLAEHWLDGICTPRYTITRQLTVIKHVLQEQQLGVLSRGNCVQEWFLVDIPGYVYQLVLAEHWFDGIDTPRYTCTRQLTVIKHVLQEQQLGVLSRGNCVQERIFMDFPGYS